MTSYVEQHGGGTIAVSSQSSAAAAIIASDADVAGIGGFSGRESDVSVAWLAQEVAAGKIRWVLAEAGGSRGGAGRGLPGDTRAGSKAAMAAVAKACRKVTLSATAADGARALPRARARASPARGRHLPRAASMTVRVAPPRCSAHADPARATSRREPCRASSSDSRLQRRPARLAAHSAMRLSVKAALQGGGLSVELSNNTARNLMRNFWGIRES